MTIEDKHKDEVAMRTSSKHAYYEFYFEKCKRKRDKLTRFMS